MKRGTQKQLAKAVGISEPFLTDILKGRRRPSIVTAKRLAEVSQVSIDTWRAGNAEQLHEALEKIDMQNDLAR